MGPQVLTEVMRHHSVPVSRCFVILPASVFLAGSPEVDMLEGHGWE